MTLILQNLYYYLGLSNSYATFGGLAYKGYTSSGTRSAVRLAKTFWNHLAACYGVVCSRFNDQVLPIR